MNRSHLGASNLSGNVRQDVFPIGQWTVTTRKGIIMQSKCTCKSSQQQQDSTDNESDICEGEPRELCDICRYHNFLPYLHSMPDMLFNNNLFRLEHFSGVGIEFNPLDALRQVEEIKDPLRVAVADGWQSARADCPYAKSIAKPFDWTFTTEYRGTLLSAMGSKRPTHSRTHTTQSGHDSADVREPTAYSPISLTDSAQDDGRISLSVEETKDRIDVNKLKVREEILFYDDVTLYEDELADHGVARYSVKVRVMPKSLFVLARYYLRVDGVLARINDTRIYHECDKSYFLREYTNREARLKDLHLPVSIMTNPNELMNHLPLMQSKYEKLSIPLLNR